MMGPSLHGMMLRPRGVHSDFSLVVPCSPRSLSSLTARASRAPPDRSQQRRACPAQPRPRRERFVLSNKKKKKTKSVGWPRSGEEHVRLLLRAMLVRARAPGGFLARDLRQQQSFLFWKVFFSTFFYFWKFIICKYKFLV